MRFGLRDLLLLVTFIAILSWLFSGNNKIVGRHLLWASLVLAGSVTLGQLFTRWSEIRWRCAIGGLLGALVYVLLSWLLIDQMIDITVWDEADYRFRTFWIEAVCLVPLSIAFGATVGTFLIFLLRKTEPRENDKINRTISAVLLGLICLAWFLAVIDRWNSNYLDSRWIGLCGLLAAIFALFTFSWMGEYVKAHSKAAFLSDKDSSSGA